MTHMRRLGGLGAFNNEEHFKLIAIAKSKIQEHDYN